MLFFLGQTSMNVLVVDITVRSIVPVKTRRGASTVTAHLVTAKIPLIAVLVKSGLNTLDGLKFFLVCSPHWFRILSF
jgi:hypothetical protein